MWYANENDGSFEAENLPQLVENIAEHYEARSDEGAVYPSFDELYFETEHGHRCQASELGLQEFENLCVDAVDELIQRIAEETEGQRQLQSDYYSSLGLH